MSPFMVGAAGCLTHQSANLDADRESGSLYWQPLIRRINEHDNSGRGATGGYE